MENILPIGLAYLIDLLIGDPIYSFHPVRLLGRWILYLEACLTSRLGRTKFAGFLLWLWVVPLAWIIVYLLVTFAAYISGYLSLALSVILIYTCIAVKDLSVQASNVYKALIRDDIVLARRQLSMIVGRDTANLSYDEIIRATVETVAESIVDGIISPLFFAFIGGAPLVLAYKAVNTLDSMVGYRNARYKDLGFFSAKTDDVANFIPARIAGFLIPMVSFLSAKDYKKSFKIMLRDRKKHPSPNSAISEAAVAGALNIQLGGDNYYDGVLCAKPLLGDKERELQLEDIKSAIVLTHITTIVFLFISSLIILIIRNFYV